MVSHYLYHIPLISHSYTINIHQPLVYHWNPIEIWQCFTHIKLFPISLVVDYSYDIKLFPISLVVNYICDIKLFPISLVVNYSCDIKIFPISLVVNYSCDIKLFPISLVVDYSCDIKLFPISFVFKSQLDKLGWYSCEIPFHIQR
jgi:hypothetical protein